MTTSTKLSVQLPLYALVGEKLEVRKIRLLLYSQATKKDEWFGEPSFPPTFYQYQIHESRSYLLCCLMFCNVENSRSAILSDTSSTWKESTIPQERGSRKEVHSYSVSAIHCLLSNPQGSGFVGLVLYCHHKQGLFDPRNRSQRLVL